MLYKTMPNFRTRGRSALKERIRNLFGVRVERQLPEPGPMPHIGDHIAHGRLAMRVSDPMPRELWDWLVFLKWRRVDPNRDRRVYQELPRDAFKKLLRCQGEQRAAYLSALLAEMRQLNTTRM